MSINKNTESYYYSLFILIDNLRDIHTHFKHMPCDDIWEIGKKFYDEFLASEYNKEKQSEYEEISYFLNHKLRNIHMYEDKLWNLHI